MGRAMSQDTRKDPRAKIVSLNVRYKSATVDEFIDNHASDVSKGGIFIKTSTPFPQGTLLKFEIRLAGDQSVIAGVGRVVWKREPANASGTERPAGMGVKFIKLDDSSRAVIDKLTASRDDAGSAFTSELEKDQTQVDVKAPATGAAALKSTQLGVGGPSVKQTIVGLGAVKPGAAAAAPPRPGGSAGTSTIVGMPAAPEPAKEAKPAAGSGFFPGTSSEADMPPPGERTVMKQAAELLEEALKEAGGSMEEVGTNPLFEKSKTPPPAAAEPPVEKAPEKIASEPPAALAHADTVALPKTVSAPAPAPAAKSEPPPKQVSTRPAAVASAKSYVAEPEEKSGGLMPFVLITLLIVVVGGGFVAYKKGVFGGAAPVDTTPPPVPTPSVTASAPPIDSAVSVLDASVNAVQEQPDAAAMVAAAKDAGLAVASAKPPTTATAPKTPKPPKPPVTASTATTAPTSTDTAPTSTSTSTDTAPTPTTTSTAPTPLPTSTSTAAPTSTSTAGSTGSRPSDDNPY